MPVVSRRSAAPRPWLRPPELGTPGSHVEERRASWLELFFDSLLAAFTAVGAGLHLLIEEGRRVARGGRRSPGARRGRAPAA